jgi:hypothetical protein
MLITSPAAAAAAAAAAGKDTAAALLSVNFSFSCATWPAIAANKRHQLTDKGHC